MKRLITLTMALATLCSMNLFAKNPLKAPQLREDNIDEVVKAMTLKEKATIVVGAGWGSMLASKALSADVIAVEGAAGTTRGIKRLGIPSIVLADGPAGLRINPTRKGTDQTFYCTGFPVGTLLACSWNQEMVEEVGKAMGNEVLEYGVDVLLAPGMNIHRNPLCGRNFEYYSEDPVLSGKTAAAFIRGIQSNGVGTSAKHFAGNNQETNRLANNSIIDENTLREIYLKGFEIAVKEAQPWTIMSSYNKLNGPFTQENRWLLTDVLRGEWGFEGLVMTDWYGQRNTAAQIAAGNDMMQPGEKAQIKELIKKVRKGQLDESLLDVCVTRVLQLIVKTPRFKGYKYSNSPDLAAHAEVSRAAATEGMVLLENNGVLPLKNTKNLALYGVGSYDTIAGGTGSGNVNKPYVINLETGLANAGFTADATLSAKYHKYISDPSNREKGFVLVGEKPWIEMPVSEDVIASSVEGNDAAVLVISRQAGESEDREVEGDFTLKASEMEMLQSLCTKYHAAGKKVIVILNVGGVVETASWKNLPDAILLAWGPGQEAGNAIADILTGKVCPSGHLSMTFPNKYEDVPSSANFPIGVKSEAKGMIATMSGGLKDKGRKNIDFTVYEEGLNVGYRYFGLDGSNVSYPFGYGLSYTTFSQEKVQNADGSYTATVTNTGSVAGKDVVMIYEDGILKAFAKTKTLAPGETQTLTL